MTSLMPSAKEVLSISTTPKDSFFVIRMDAKEYLSTIPEFDLELVGQLEGMVIEKPKDIDLAKLLGTTANVKFDVAGDPRHFNGYIVRAERGQRKGRYETFSVQLRPWLWFATRTRNSRVFQAESVKDIVSKVLTEYSSDFEFKMMPGMPPPKLDYCVQYDETDFDFVSRLLEEAGIYYYFKHEESKHTMVLTDSMALGHLPPRKGPISWADSMKSDATITNWHSKVEARSVKAVVKDYDYLASKTEIKAEKTPKDPNKKLSTMEVFEFQARLAQNQAKPESQSASSAATKAAELLMEGLTSMATCHTGLTNARDLAVGMTFMLAGTQRTADMGMYLVVGAKYKLEFADHEGIEDLKTGKRKDGFQSEITCISTSGPAFRPPRVTPRPVVHGPQTAVVVGASGNEIETDKHGRVKVQFHWDRLGKKDEKSSCWVRVAQFSAGKGFGLWSVPRVGQEVVVSFLGGDPDRPIITGSVYNDQNVLAYELPKLATVSGWRTFSSKDGGADMYNELRFDDAKEKEYLWIQAQRDYYRNVKKNVFDMVGENETIKVKMTRKEVIGENAYLDVGKDVMHNIGKDLHTKVAGDVFLTGAATYQLKIQKEMSVEVGSDLGIATKSGKVQIKGGQDIVIESTSKITLSAGGSTIVIGPSGVTIDGAQVKVNCGGGGGSASPKSPTDAKTLEELTKSEYDKQFEDPIPKKT